MALTAMAKPAYNHRHRELRKALGIGAGARCYWCGGFATDLDHLIPVAEGGANGPKVPACRACNNKRAKEVQAQDGEAAGGRRTRRGQVATATTAQGFATVAVVEARGAAAAAAGVPRSDPLGLSSP